MTGRESNGRCFDTTGPSATLPAAVPEHRTQGPRDCQVGSQTQTACACFELTTYLGFWRPSGHCKISTCFIPKGLIKEASPWQEGTSHVTQQEHSRKGGKPKEPPASLTQAVPKTSLLLKWYHTGNGLFAASAVRKIKRYSMLLQR